MKASHSIACALSVASAGCAAGWTGLPRIGDGTAPLAAAVLVRDYASAEVQEVLADRSAVAFEAASARGDEVEVPAEGASLRFSRTLDGSWHLGAADGPEVELLAGGAVGGLSDMVFVGGGKVCHSTCTLASVLENRCAFGEPSSQEDVKSACYAIPAFIPAPPRRLAARFALDGVEVYWIPVTDAGAPDPSREGAVVWSYFDLYNPDGSGHVARLRVVDH